MFLTLNRASHAHGAPPLTVIGTFHWASAASLSAETNSSNSPIPFVPGRLATTPVVSLNVSSAFSPCVKSASKSEPLNGWLRKPGRLKCFQISSVGSSSASRSRSLIPLLARAELSVSPLQATASTMSPVAVAASRA